MNHDDAEALADALAEKGWLTAWQAETILQGRHRFHFGNFKLLSKLGQGGMGVVFRAEDVRNHKIVAIKIMSRKMRMESKAVARFVREAETTALMDHPNVVSYHDSEITDQNHILVMEFVPGKNLNWWIDQFGRLPIDWSCECARQVASGLEHAYQLGLIHRDIKPGNILVVAEDPDSFPQVKILDLGLAREVGSDGMQLTATAEVLGTPDYLALEHIHGSRNVDIRADIYSLGATLYKMLVGEVPFPVTGTVEKMMARSKNPPPSPKAKRDEIPAALDVVVRKMMARKAEDRYQTPQEVADALAPFCLQGEVPTEPSSAPDLASHEGSDFDIDSDSGDFEDSDATPLLDDRASQAIQKLGEANGGISPKLADEMEQMSMNVKHQRLIAVAVACVVLVAILILVGTTLPLMFGE